MHNACSPDDRVPNAATYPRTGPGVQATINHSVDPRFMTPMGDDFNPPQSAQCYRRRSEEPFMEAVGSTTSLKVTSLRQNSGSQGALTDFDDATIDNEDGLEEAMQALAERTTSDGDWRKQDPTDDELIADITMDDSLPEWLSGPTHSTIGDAVKDEPTTTSLTKRLASSLPTSQSSCILADISGNGGKAKHAQATLTEGSENEYSDSDMDTSFVDLTTSDDAQPSTLHTSPQRAPTPKLQWLPLKNFTPAKSPHVTELPQVPYKVQFDAYGEPIPFLRPPFPKPILDRSPILGLTNRTVLRTCFRIGEALNAASIALRSNMAAVIELYARVISSHRNGYKQHFQFADLFTDKPPYLIGLYGTWKGVGLWEEDSAAFLGQGGRGKMCRALGRIKKGENGRGVEMSIMSIWECGWKDVGLAKGIVCL
ncbi:MAG: hypothetical protein Q9163_004763 [Psora crenata]